MRTTLDKTTIVYDDEIATGIVRRYVGFDANRNKVAVVWTQTDIVAGGRRVEHICGGFAFRDEVQPILDVIPVSIPILDPCNFDNFADCVARGPDAIDGMRPDTMGQQRMRDFFATGNTAPRTVTRVIEVVRTTGRGPLFTDKWGNTWRGRVDAVRDCATGETWCEQDESGNARRLSREEYGDDKIGRKMERMLSTSWTVQDAWEYLGQIVSSVKF